MNPRSQKLGSPLVVITYKPYFEKRGTFFSTVLRFVQKVLNSRCSTFAGMYSLRFDWVNAMSPRVPMKTQTVLTHRWTAPIVKYFFVPFKHGRKKVVPCALRNGSCFWTVFVFRGTPTSLYEGAKSAPPRGASFGVHFVIFYTRGGALEHFLYFCSFAHHVDATRG